MEYLAGQIPISNPDCPDHSLERAYYYYYLYSPSSLPIPPLVLCAGLTRPWMTGSHGSIKTGR
jgi:hypothetical protein